MAPEQHHFLSARKRYCSNLSATTLLTQYTVTHDTVSLNYESS